MPRTIGQPHVPLVGLTTSELRTPETLAPIAQSEPTMRELALGRTYPAALERAGAVPVIVPPMRAERIDALLAGLSGLVLTGGPDLHPRAYGAAPHPALGPTVEEIDLFELALIRAADRRRLPVFAICRGMQALNVARGGTLVQDLPTEVGGDVVHRQAEPGWVATHPVRLTPSSRLAALLGATEAQVNSFHHQALRDLGAGLHAVGWAPDGVVEAVEGDDDRFVVGVQWHAESLDEAPGHRRVLEAFVAAARGAAGGAVGAAA
jgi:putative glutamine amidotransferase